MSEDYKELSTCDVLLMFSICVHVTNEPTGEDLCTRWLAVSQSARKGLDLGALNADWVSQMERATSVCGLLRFLLVHSIL